MRSPWLHRAERPDTSSVAAIIDGIIKPGMSDREKAEAVYDFLRNHVYHWPAVHEGTRAHHFEYGVVFDPIKLINGYGYGYCFQNRAALHALWQAAGLTARTAGLSGHAIAEVWYDGRWHYYDADQHGYCLLPDGQTVAALTDLENDPIGLLLRPKHRPDPYFPATKEPRAPYESAVILAGYAAAREKHWYQHNKVVLGHDMGVTLLPGMRLEYRFQGDGRWRLSNRNLKGEYEIGYIEPAQGPCDPLSGTTYANGELLYQPDLRSSSNEYREGVWEDAHVRQTADGIEPAVSKKEGRIVFRIRLPYPIVGWPTSFHDDEKPVGAVLLGARFVRHDSHATQKIEISTDHGQSWTTVWKASEVGVCEAVVDLTPWVVHHYEYRVRMVQQASDPSAARLERLSIRTTFQCAPRVLPALRAGANAMIFTLGDQTESYDWRLDVSADAAFRQQAVSVRNLILAQERIHSVDGHPGEAIFVFEPPLPGTLSHMHLHLGCRREPGQQHPEDRLALHISENDGATWRQVWQDEWPAWASHWSFHANVPWRVRAEQALRRILVKLEICTARSAQIGDMQVRVHWRPEGSLPGFPVTGVCVEHLWLEGEQAHRHLEHLTAAPTRYTVETGSAPRNDAVRIWPVRAGTLAFREHEPLIRRPPLPTDDPVNRVKQREIRRLLRLIDQDPDCGLPEAAACDIAWLAQTAAQALDFHKRGII